MNGQLSNCMHATGKKKRLLFAKCSNIDFEICSNYERKVYQTSQLFFLKLTFFSTVKIDSLKT